MEAYWINLNDRKDRASQCIIQLSKIGIIAIRVSAVTRSEVGFVENTENLQYFQGIIACRMSHIKALNAFLSSSNEFGLILEDDFLFSEKMNISEFLNIQDLMRIRNIQLLQLGFLPRGTSLPAFLAIPKRLFSFFQHSINCFLTCNNQSKRITHGFLPGAHAYIVNREMALHLIRNAQSDLKIPIDLWLNKIAKEMNSVGVLIGRLKYSMVAQNESFESDLQI